MTTLERQKDIANDIRATVAELNAKILEARDNGLSVVLNTQAHMNLGMEDICTLYVSVKRSL